MTNSDLHTATNKRLHDSQLSDQDNESDGSDFGPTVPMSGTDQETNSVLSEKDRAARLKKKQKLAAQLQHQKLFLDSLPCTDMYEVSLMHRDIVNLISCTSTDFIITTSIDGHVKFWKKSLKGIEFVKHFRSHVGAIVATDASFDGLLFATAGVDKGLKVFDVINFDMITMFKLNYFPAAVCWIYKKSQAKALLACSDKETSTISLYDGRGGTTCIQSITTLHSVPVNIIKYNHIANTVVSVDDGGMIEYWTPNEFSDQGFDHPKPSAVSWEFKGETDLYEFKKAKTVPTCLQFSPDFSKFVTFGFGDRQIRIFNFRTGKLMRKYDESLSVVSEMQQAGTAIHTLDDMEFGRRLAIEREIEKASGGQSATVNAVFDESGTHVIYPTLIGIKVVNILSNKVVCLIGKGETQRFMNLTLYQGAPKQKIMLTLAMAASNNPLVKDSEMTDPTLFCTAYKKPRFYSFTRREPDSEGAVASGSGNRDIFNEKPSREEQTVAAASSHKQTMGSTGIIHTTFGDIHIRLFPEQAPKSVENFIELSKKGYFDNVLFHRVIKGFMLQTGDPLGDGTGGESCWGKEFEDEFHRSVKHDRPYTLSMANCGPNTNGSQFFITTAPTPWLDNKHTIFGRATGGMNVIHRIENAKTDKSDKPLEDIRIMSVEVR
ncbi:Peptidyl-prolyl cis-trans isomerase cyp15 [Batrachochytrium dendrobatidis]|nr:Peptidyl-prolyl cis-trans isomerase cyp15 [Batrachochytrium dendrobatidis]